MTDIPQYKIGQFNSKHDVTEDQQFKMLCEEIGELAEALNTDTERYEIAEELADIIFVTRSIAELREINISNEVVETIEENLDKDTSKDGQKITKSGI